MKDKKLPSQKTRKLAIKSSVNTNPNYGKRPSDRTVNELLNSGFINLDKPNGPTSHQVDAWVKKIFNIKKVGHGGTLDPNATGVLPIAIGDGTKILNALLPLGKEYIGIMKLHKDVKTKKIKDVCSDFIGVISQMPPVRSAVKRRRRKRSIYYLDIIEINKRDVLFKVGCESGTYVRTLCVDIGKKLGCGAHLADLRRTKVGHLKESDSVYLQDLKDAMVFYNDGAEDSIKSLIQPVEEMLKSTPKIIIRDSAVDAICHGANLAVPGVVEVDTDINKNDLIAVMTLKGEAVALMKAVMSTTQIVEKDKGICAKLERVIMKKGTYPPIWKKS